MPNKETLLEFPCTFSVKAMGLASDDFAQVVTEIISQHVDPLPADATTTKNSSNGKYHSVSVTFQATSKAQLDAIYMDLTANERVLMSL